MVTTDVGMRYHFDRIVGVAISLAVALAALWACAEKSPTRPTPPAACTFSLSESSLSFGAPGGSVTISMTTAAGCAWTAASDRGWMAIDSGAGGTGPGTVGVQVTANATTAARTGTLTIGGHIVAVSQAAAEACSIAVAPASASFPKDASGGTFTVTTAASCAWTALSDAGWVTLTSPSSGRGTASVTYTVARNAGLSARSGTVHVGDATLAIAQAGDSGVCQYQVAPVELGACMSVPHELT